MESDGREAKAETRWHRAAGTFCYFFVSSILLLYFTFSYFFYHLIVEMDLIFVDFNQFLCANLGNLRGDQGSLHGHGSTLLPGGHRVGSHEGCQAANHIVDRSGLEVQLTIVTCQSNGLNHY